MFFVIQSSDKVKNAEKRIVLPKMIPVFIKIVATVPMNIPPISRCLS